MAIHMTTKIKKPTGKATVKEVHYEDEEVESTEEVIYEEDLEDEEELPEEQWTQPHATVGFKTGVTRNLGDYNSLKIEVSLYMPCYPQEVEETFDFVKGYVEEKVNALTDEYLGDEEE